MSHATIVERFIDQAGRDDARMLRPRSANIIPSNDNRSLYSYGSHFTLVRLMPANRQAPSGWWLLNGDTYSSSTSGHQRIVRRAVEKDGRPYAIVSFDAMASAGIDRETVTIVEALPDRTLTIEHSGANLNDVPEYLREWKDYSYPDECVETGCSGENTFTIYGGGEHTTMCRHRGQRMTITSAPRYSQDESGRYHWTEDRHVLGETVFSANVREVRHDSEGRRVQVEYAAMFLSAFDHQESHLHYFLAELPPQASEYRREGEHWAVRTVADAFRVLRPATVLEADTAGVEVTRQGDMFAVPHPDLTTRRLTELGAVRERGGRIDGSSHTATETAVVPADPFTGRKEATFARGMLWHRPVGFRNPRTDPGHRRQRMGDGKAWHRVVRNTVPRMAVGNTARDVRPRSWTRGGNVD